MSAWTRVIHIQATAADPDPDADAAFTMTVERGEVTSLRDGPHGTPDFVISGRGEDLEEFPRSFDDPDADANL